MTTNETNEKPFELKLEQYQIMQANNMTLIVIDAANIIFYNKIYLDEKQLHYIIKHIVSIGWSFKDDLNNIIENSFRLANIFLAALPQFMDKSFDLTDSIKSIEYIFPDPKNIKIENDTDRYDILKECFIATYTNPITLNEKLYEYHTEFELKNTDNRDYIDYPHFNKTFQLDNVLTMEELKSLVEKEYEKLLRKRLIANNEYYKKNNLQYEDELFEHFFNKKK